LLPYHPPYHWPAMLAFLGARAVPATEQVTSSGWHRSLRIEQMPFTPRGGDKRDAAIDASPAAVIVSVHDEPRRSALRVDLSAPLPDHAVAHLSSRLAAMFDVACDPLAVQAALGQLAAAEPGLRLPGSMDSFELVVRAILGQQVTVAAARTVAGRLIARYGTPLPAAAPAAPA